MRSSGAEMLGQWTGSADNVFIDFTTTVLPGDYVGPGNDQVKLRFRAWSDAGYDDQDCLSPSHGACQIDDITVSLDSLVVTFDDFEAGSPVNWIQEEFSGVGDFSSLRNNLEDLDPCQTNYSYQVNFVDDGLIVPGTGGEACLNWSYGPSGYVVNHSGGGCWPMTPGTGSSTTRSNLRPSPGQMAWMGPSSVSMSGCTKACAQIAPWEDRNFVFSGGPEYRRHDEPVSDLLVENPRWVQLALGVNEMGWVWGWTGTDGSPAPYFDNVVLKGWKSVGPEILVLGYQNFSDAFVEAGVLNPGNLAANSCRVDIVDDVQSSQEAVAIHGDSLLALVTPRLGAIHAGPPELHWAMLANAAFDSVRPATPGPDRILRGSVQGIVINDYQGNPTDKYSFDLPDTGFFYPGDILHYFITASDDLGGDIGMASWPPDTTSVLDFSLMSLLPRLRGNPSLAKPDGAGGGRLLATTAVGCRKRRRRRARPAPDARVSGAGLCPR